MLSVYLSSSAALQATFLKVIALDKARGYAGMQGLNIMQFCKEYNAATQDKVGTVIPVEITCFEVRDTAYTLPQLSRAP